MPNGECGPNTASVIILVQFRAESRQCKDVPGIATQKDMMGKLVRNYLQMLMIMDFLNKRKQENVMNFQSVLKMLFLAIGPLGQKLVVNVMMKQLAYRDLNRKEKEPVKKIS